MIDTIEKKISSNLRKVSKSCPDEAERLVDLYNQLLKVISERESELHCIEVVNQSLLFTIVESNFQYKRMGKIIKNLSESEKTKRFHYFQLGESMAKTKLPKWIKAILEC